MADLAQVDLAQSSRPFPAQGRELVRRGLERARGIDCFDFVPSDPDAVWSVLSALPAGRFCEWGSGIGIVTGLAALAGFRAHGIEIHPELAEASRALLAELGLDATIETGDYHALHRDADVYFAYTWPGKQLRLERRFLESAPDGALLVVCDGAENPRGKRKRREGGS